jgi:uncharacterized membrane protein
MKPLIILLAVFGITSLFLDLALSGDIAMCVMLCFTALGHFKFKAGMARMIPKSIPFKSTVVYATGIAEIGMGIGLLFSATRTFSAILLIAFLAAVLPANIYAAMGHINFETGEANGKGPGYLWFRIPLQLFFIGWIVFFSLLMARV